HFLPVCQMYLRSCKQPRRIWAERIVCTSSTRLASSLSPATSGLPAAGQPLVALVVLREVQFFGKGARSGAITRGISRAARSSVDDWHDSTESEQIPEGK